MTTRIQLRRGNASEWTSANPILLSGEIGIELDTNKFKVGDGSNSWSSLSYVGGFLAEDTASATYATISSPTFTGTPLAPTAASGTNTTQIATTAFVATEISNLIDSAPSNLNTLNELAAALNNDASFSTTVTNSLSDKLDFATASTLYLPISSSSNFVQLIISTNNQTGESYELISSDSGKLIEMNSASANTIIIPLDSSVSFPIGTKIDILQTGVGQTTASAVSGVTIQSKEGNRKLTGQWSAASIIKRGTDEWTLIGDLSA